MPIENMTIDQFIEEQHELLDTFALWWKAQQVKEGADKFPFQMRPGDWDEAFHFFDLDDQQEEEQSFLSPDENET